MFTYRATVAKVIDGDTIDLVVDLGFHVSIHIRTRLLGIDAPEVSTVEGRAVREALRVALPVGAGVTVETFKANGDKYGRWLAKIAAPFGDVAAWMIELGYARVYDGGAR